MPVKRKTDGTGPLPELLTYGSTTPIDLVRAQLGNNAQLFYDQWAFARRVPIDRGGLPRPVLFKRIANILAPNYFEWHGCYATRRIPPLSSALRLPRPFANGLGHRSRTFIQAFPVPG